METKRISEESSSISVPAEKTLHKKPLSAFERYKESKSSYSDSGSVKPSTSGLSYAEKVLQSNSNNSASTKSIDAVSDKNTYVRVDPAKLVQDIAKHKPQSSGSSESNILKSAIDQNETGKTDCGSSASTEANGQQSGYKLNAITVSPRQKGNPILKNIRNVPWEFDDIVPDYVMGRSTCALFLSLRYHNLHPNYIHNRLKELGSMYELRVLLVLVDSKDPQHSLRELAKICILANCTLILAWSNEEAGRYLETYKSYENKPPDIIMERTERNYNSQMVDCLTSVKSVNKTDAMTLLSSFGSFEKISKASLDDLSLCPGFGPQKKQKLYDIFRTPFKKEKLSMTPSSSKSADGSNLENSPAKKSKKD